MHAIPIQQEVRLQPPQDLEWNQLTKWAQATIVCFCVAFILLVSTSTFVGLSSLLFLFWIWFLDYLRRKRWANIELVEYDSLIRIFGVGFFPGPWIVLFFELLTTLIFAVICFSNQFDEWKDQIDKNPNPSDISDLKVRKNAGYYIFLFLSAFFTAALVEEYFKFKILIRAIRQRYRESRYLPLRFYQDVVLLALCGTLGFSIFENIGYTLQAYSSSEEGDRNANEVLLETFLSALSRSVISTPMHLLTSILIGLGVGKHIFSGQLPILPQQPPPFPLVDFSWIATLKILAIPIFFHGLFDFCLMLISASDSLSSMTQVWISILIAIIILVTFVCYVHHVWGKTIPPQFQPLDEQRPQHEQEHEQQHLLNIQHYQQQEQLHQGEV